jgi:hypothetical protein
VGTDLPGDLRIDANIGCDKGIHTNFVCFEGFVDSMSNMAAPYRRPFRPGVYVPLPTFFDENQNLDYDTYKDHLLSMYF